MAYGLGSGVFIDDDSAEPIPKVRSRRSIAQSWQALSAAYRLEVIEQALLAVNDRIDEFPIAL